MDRSLFTKSEYLRYLECPLHLWLHRNRPDEIRQVIDPQLQLIFEQGAAVEALARRLFPQGALVTGHSELSEKETRSLIAAGNKALFQATAVADGLLAMADIFELDSATNTWNLYEVKSTTGVEDVHVRDLCFQMIAFEKAGYTVGKMYLVHVNNQYVRHGEIDANAFLIEEQITDRVREIEADVLLEIEAAKVVVANPVKPSTEICTCYPKDCICVDCCYPELPEYSVFNFTGIWASKARELYDNGIRNLLDTPADHKLTAAQANQLQVARSGQPMINVPAIRKELACIQYPIAFLDYESAFPAIPLFDRYRPYQQMVFQYSLHLLSEDGHLTHFDFLARKLEDPVEDVARSLQEVLPDSGIVIVWNKTFEKNRNDEMAVLAPEYEEFLRSVNGRVFDLMDIFKQQLYVHPEFRGSCSIKKVLPVLVPHLSYKDLVIQEGGTASVTWHRMLTDGRSESDFQKTRQDLLDYCELDTLAMVEVFKHLQQL